MGDARSARLAQLVDDARSWPSWRPAASAIGPALLALVIFLTSDVERPAVLALLLAVAVAPWIVEGVRGCAVPWPWRYVTPVALAAQHLLGEPLGIVDPRASQQTSLLILCYAVGETAAIATRRHIVVVFAIGVATAVGSGLVDDNYDATDIWTAGMFVGLFCGLLIRRLLLALIDVNEAQAALEEDAVARERHRIAREVHDVIAHSMTVTMLHVTAARMAVGRGDAAAATEALEEAERQGRRSLADIRSTVGLLRSTDDGTGTAAALPHAGDLEELLAGYRAAGIAVESTVDGRLDDLPAPVGLAVHRIVQEALANVVKHAPGASASVSVRVGAEVEVEVVDTGSTTAAAEGAGHGILGMRERAESLGGTFEAGRTASGWRVRATIPLAQP